MTNEIKEQLMPLLHAMATGQIMYDELYKLPESCPEYYRFELKKATKNWLNVSAKAMAYDLNQIWGNIPNEEFDSYLEAKKNIISKLMFGSFEAVNYVSQCIDDAELQQRNLEIIEKILNTHCIPTMREQYREQLGYTLSDFEQSKSK